MTIKPITIGTAFALMATSALSQTTRAQVVQELANQGYTNIEISRTLFGNTKIEASNASSEREIVLDRNGNVLRDLVESEDDADEQDDGIDDQDDESDDDGSDDDGSDDDGSDDDGSDDDGPGDDGDSETDSDADSDND